MECIKCKKSIPEDALFCQYCGKKQVPDTRKRTKRGNGTGTVYKRGNTWVAEVTKGYKTDGDKRKRVVDKKGGFKTKKEALEYIPTLQGRQKKEKNITWNKLYELWLPTHRAGKSTIDCYKAASKYFAPIEFYQLKDIEIDDLQECLDECPKGKRTRENMKALCGLMYKYAIPRGYANLNFALYLIVSGESGFSRESFSAEQLDKICKAVGTIPYSATYKSLKPVYDGLQKIKFEKPRAKYKAEHADELKMFYTARRKLTEEFPDGKVDMGKLSKEYDTLEQEHETTYSEFKTVREDLQRLWKVKSNIDTAVRFHQRTAEQKLQNQPQTRHKKEDMTR